MATNPIPDQPRPGPSGRGSLAFLLSQVGAWAGHRFGQRLADIGMTPSEAGLIWIISHSPAHNQQQLSTMMGVAPSRMVALIDGLADQELVERARSSQDRRVSIVQLTQQGHQALTQLRRIALDHDQEVGAVLDDNERQLLHQLLTRLADNAELPARVHPGYARP